MMLLAAVFLQYGRRVEGGYELTISDKVLRAMANRDDGGTVVELTGNRFMYSPSPMVIEGVISEPSTEVQVAPQLEPVAK